MWEALYFRRSLILVIILYALTVQFIGISAQEESGDHKEFNYSSILNEMGSDTVTLLSEINKVRLRQGISPLAPNAILNTIAQTHLGELQNRGEVYGDVHTRRDGTTVNEWLRSGGYPSYSSDNPNYQPDVIAVVTGRQGDFLPKNIIEYWVNNPRGLISLRMSQNGSANLPIFSTRYREVGLAYAKNLSNGRSLFVMIFASQPNAMPVIVAQSASPDLAKAAEELHLIRDAVTRRDVVLFISNELAYPNGDGNAIGQTVFMRITEQNDIRPCPTSAADPQGWIPYAAEYPFLLSESLGIKQIHVYFCDAIGRQTETEVPVLFTDNPNQTVYIQWTAIPGVREEPTPTFTPTLTSTPTATLIPPTPEPPTVEPATPEPPTPLPPTPEPPTVEPATPEPPTPLPPTPEPPTVEPATPEPPTALPPTPEPTIHTALSEQTSTSLTPEIELAWNWRYFALRNISSQTLDLRDLSFVGETNNRLNVIDWMHIAQSPVERVEAGKCLLAYVITNPDAEISAKDIISELALLECSDQSFMVGVSPQTQFVWERTFEVHNGTNQVIATCISGSPCQFTLDGSVQVALTAEKSPDENLSLDGGTLELIWTISTPHWLLIRNVSNLNLDLATMAMIGDTSGSLSLGSRIDVTLLQQIKPDSCILVYSADLSETPIPTTPNGTVLCPREPLRIAASFGELIWTAPNTAFIVSLEDQTITCAIGTRCTINVPHQGR